MVLTLSTHQQSHTHVSSIIKDCINFNVCFHSLNFLHVRRESDQTAHYLAKYALHNPDRIWIEETSACISTLLPFDLLLMTLSLM